MRTTVHAALVSGVFLLTVQVGLGQVTTATIYGTVQDPSGAAVPGARVTATNELTATTKSTASNGVGEFTITFLPVGAYTITIEAGGFKVHRERGLQLVAGQRANLVYALELGAVSDSVDVRAVPPLLQASSAEQTITLTETQRAELPLARRDFTALVGLGPGIAAGGSNELGSGTSGAQGAKVVVNGLAGSAFTFTIDGTDATGDPLSPSLSNYQNFNFIKGISIEAIREVQVAKNIFSAEIAGTLSGNVNIISKSGSNELHGSVFNNYQAGGLNAQDPFIGTKAPLIFHQFGGSVGGPVIRDKVFFFGVYEGYRLKSQTSVNGNVPTQAFRDRLLAAQPVYKRFLDLLPLPNGPQDPNATTGFFQSVGSQQAHDNHLTVRGDWNLTSTNFFNVRFTRFVPYRLVPRISRENPQFWDGTSFMVTANLTHAAPGWSSETRFGYNSNGFRRIDGLFDLVVPGITALGFGNNGEGTATDGFRWNLEHVIAHVRGAHSLKYGAIFQFLEGGSEGFQMPGYTYNTEQALLTNIPDSIQFDFAFKPWSMTRWRLGGFIQDDVRFGSRLTVNLGIRYDYWQVPKERDGRLFNRESPYGPFRPPDSMINADHNNFSPRVGFAWSLGRDRRTVLRGGFGMFVTEQPLRGPLVMLVADAPRTPTRVIFSRQEALNFGLRYPDNNDKARPLVGDMATLALGALNPNFPNPYALQWTLGLQRQVTNNIVIEAAYVGNHLVKGILTRDWNRVDRVTGLRPQPLFSQFRWFDSSESSHYHGLQTSVRKRLAQHLLFNVSYTWSNAIAFAEGDIVLGSNEFQAQDIDNLKAERGPSPNNLRHRMVTDFVYELPLHHWGRDRYSRLLFTGWQVSGIFAAQTGFPLYIVQPTALPGSRPDYVGGTPVLEDYRQTLRYLNPSTFARVPLVTASGGTQRPGNVGKGAVRGPGFWNTDLSMSKSLYFTERTRLQLRADLFNALNHRQFSGIATNINAANFGRLTSVRGMRAIQLGARFTF